MEHIAPLIQTVLWVGLIAGIVWRFHRPIDGILSALHKRLEAGSTLKAGPFELSGELRPQDAKSVQAKAANEVMEVLQAGEPVAPVTDVPSEAVSPRALPPTNADSDPPRPEKTEASTAALVQSRVFRAEDLVLRAIQAEYGVPVSRQITAGRDLGFDGAFVNNGRTTIIEVKYARSLSNLARYKESLYRLVSTVERYAWPNAQVLFAVVFERVQDVGPGAKKLEEIVARSPVDVVVRSYSLAELEERFGLASRES